MLIRAGLIEMMVFGHVSVTTTVKGSCGAAAVCKGVEAAVRYKLTVVPFKAAEVVKTEITGAPETTETVTPYEFVCTE
jgi:hypothetical protein